MLLSRRAQLSRCAATIAGAILVASACGDRANMLPAAPAPVLSPPIDGAPVSRPIAVPTGDAWLQIWGLALSSNPAEPVCAPRFVPPQGTTVVTPVKVEQQGQVWVATSRPGSGTVEMHFSQTGVASMRGEVVAGTIRGVARDTSVGSFYPATNVSVTLAGLPEPEATLEGIGSSAVAFLYGTLRGQFAFHDPGGATSICRLLYWTLQPAGGALPAPSRIVVPGG